MRSIEVLRPGVAHALRAPDYVDVRVLSAGVNQAHTVPENARYVIFSATADFFVSYEGAEAVVPVAAVTDGTGNELNPSIRYLKNMAELNLISPVACTVTMAFYKA